MKNINYRYSSNNGMNTLMKTCIIENLEIIKLLIEDYEAEINAQNDIQKWVALDFTMLTKNTEIINYLKSKEVISRINEIFPYKLKKRFSQVVIYFFHDIMHLLVQEVIKDYKAKFI